MIEPSRGARRGATATLAICVVVVTALTLPAGVAAADTANVTIGENFANNSACSSGPYTIFQLSSSATRYSVPANGVITSVRLTGDPTIPVVRGFRLGRDSSRSSNLIFTVVASADPVSIAPGQTVTQSVRIPARAGDVIGEFVAELSSTCALGTSSSHDVIGVVNSREDVGEEKTYRSGRNYRIPVSARVEQDRDGDGYGDATQDYCPRLTRTHGVCPLGRPTGRAAVGKVLTAPRTRVPARAHKAFQWYRAVRVTTHGRVVVRAIPGAHRGRYKLRKRDRGSKVFVVVTVSSPGADTSTVRSRPRRVH